MTRWLVPFMALFALHAAPVHAAGTMEPGLDWAAPGYLPGPYTIGGCITIASLDSDAPILGPLTCPAPVSVDAVASCGADPSGVADSAAGLNNCIASNRTLVLRSTGNFRFSSTATAATALCCALDPAAVLIQSVTNFTLDCDGATIIVDPSIALSSAIQADRSTNVAIKNCNIIGSRSGLTSAQENAGITLTSDAGVTLRDITFTGYGGNGAAIAGDWLVNLDTENLTMNGVGHCYDVAFLLHSRIGRTYATGADTNGASGAGSVGQNCFSIINDVPNAGQNNTGITFPTNPGYTVALSDDVDIAGIHESNFATGAYVQSGTHLRFAGNAWQLNPGIGGAKGLGIYLQYTTLASSTGATTSVGAAPSDISINGDGFLNNGAVTAGYGVVFDSSLITNADLIQNVTIANSHFDNNSNTGMGAVSAAHLLNILLNGNYYSGAAQSTPVDVNLNSVATRFDALAFNPSSVITLPNNIAIDWLDTSGIGHPVLAMSPSNITFLRPGSSGAYIQLQDFSGTPLMQAATSGIVANEPFSVTALTASYPVYSDGSKNLTSTAPASLSGTTASIGGSALAAGACASGSLALSGAATTSAVIATPATYPGDGIAAPKAYVSAAGTVTVKICAIVAATPAASTYRVVVTP